MALSNSKVQTKVEEPRPQREVRQEDQSVTRLRNAVINNEIVQMKELSRNVDEETMTKMLWMACGYSGCTSETVSTLIYNGANAKAVDGMGRTMAHEAAEYCNAAALEPLKIAGVKLDAPDHSSSTPLITAVSFKNRNSSDERYVLETVKTLLQLGVSTDRRNRYGKSAEDLANLNGHTNVVVLIRAHNCKDSIRD